MLNLSNSKSSKHLNKYNSVKDALTSKLGKYSSICSYQTIDSTVKFMILFDYDNISFFDFVLQFEPDDKLVVTFSNKLETFMLDAVIEKEYIIVEAYIDTRSGVFSSFFKGNISSFFDNKKTKEFFEQLLLFHTTRDR